MASDIYEANETMRILGRQSSCQYVLRGGTGYNDYRQLLRHTVKQKTTIY